MVKLKDIARKIKYRLTHGFFTIENVVLLLAIMLCFMWAFKSIEAMSRNWELTERLSEERRSLELLRIENQLAELENEYYKSDEYQELLARKSANKQLPGEHMVYMPENSEAAKNKHAVKTEVVEETEKSNLEKWMMFLFPKH